MFSDRPSVMTIAGHDPSGGAGLLADIKTFDAIGVHGLSVCTSLTVQNGVSSTNVEWTSDELVLAQIDSLFEQFEINFIKIGVIRNESTLLKVLGQIKKHNPNAVIVWDPILKASSGLQFFNFSAGAIEKLASLVDLITPNIPEIKQLMNENDESDALAKLSLKTNVYLKGGHSNDSRIMDEIIIEGNRFSIEKEKLNQVEKRGTGCILSAAIIAYLALGESLINACKKASEYIDQYIASNKSTIGIHQPI